MIALIDGDLAIYRATVGAQTTIDTGDGLGVTDIVDKEQAARAAYKTIKDWTKRSGCSTAIVCLSSGDNFRKKIYPQYKANRTSEKPAAYHYAIEQIATEYKLYRQPGLEADDLMGTVGTSEAGQFVIVSTDKDMRTIPGIVFNPDKDRRPRPIKLALADQAWMGQTMMGDGVDGYGGIPGVGEVISREIMLNPHRLIKRPNKRAKSGFSWKKGEPCSLWQSMCDYAEKGGMVLDELIVQAQLSRILRNGEFDQEARVVKLWTPTGYRDLPLDV